MGDFDDMNATPLGKLPLPAVQSKNDGPRVDMGVSYADMLKDMQQQQAQAQQQQVAPPQTPQFQQPPVMAPLAVAPHQAFMQQNYETTPPMQQMQRRGGGRGGRRAPSMDDYGDYDDDVPEVRRGGSGGGAKSWTARIKPYKSSLLVGLIVFAMLSYGAPRLAVSFPRLLNAAGKFNILGLAVIATISGGTHALAERYVKS